MRWLVGFLCVCSLTGCGGTSADVCSGANAGVCEGLGIYSCIDQLSCTPMSGVEGWLCCAITEAECAMHAEGPAADDDRSFCKLHVHYDGTRTFTWVRDAFCNQDSDCGEYGECWQEPGMPRGECGIACIDECQDDADCPEGWWCDSVLGCGGCGEFWPVCRDGEVKVCYPNP